MRQTAPVSFFEPPSPPERPEPPFEIPERQPWWGVPGNELGAAVPIRVVLGRTEQVAVAVVGVTAYTTGFSLTLACRWRSTPRDGDFYSDLEMFSGRGMRGPLGAELPPDLLRFGVQFADGRKATTVGGATPFPPGLTSPDEEPSGLILSPTGGHGSDGEWDQGYWLWPLPPPGALTFAIEWTSKGIEFSMHDVDAGLIIEASKSSEVLWADSGEEADSYHVTQLLHSVREPEPPEDEQPA